MADRIPPPAVPSGTSPGTPGADTASARARLSLRSAGLLAWVPPGRAFLDGGGLLHLQAAVALGATAALAALFVLYALLHAEPVFVALAVPTSLAAAAGGALVERRLRARPTDAGTEPAVEAALRARARRAAARELAGRDRALAHDLRIGRPDLPSPYDDGGLVDLNSAPAHVLVGELGLSEAEAAHVVRVREHVGAFGSPDDLVALAGLDQSWVDRLADRLVVLP